MRQDEPDVAEAVAIDWRDLAPETLQNVLEDLVTRGEPDEVRVEVRCRQLLQAIQQGKTGLFFDPTEGTIFLAQMTPSRPTTPEG